MMDDLKIVEEQNGSLQEEYNAWRDGYKRQTHLGFIWKEYRGCGKDVSGWEKC